jgi:hypothetical protein
MVTATAVATIKTTAAKTMKATATLTTLAIQI